MSSMVNHTSRYMLLQLFHSDRLFGRAGDLLLSRSSGEGGERSIVVAFKSLSFPLSRTEGVHIILHKGCPCRVSVKSSSFMSRVGHAVTCGSVTAAVKGFSDPLSRISDGLGTHRR